MATCETCFEDEATEENFGTHWRWGSHADEVEAERRRALAYAHEFNSWLVRICGEHAPREGGERDAPP